MTAASRGCDNLTENAMTTDDFPSDIDEDPTRYIPRADVNAPTAPKSKATMGVVLALIVVAVSPCAKKAVVEP
jgi:hypothetical protein